MTARAAIGWVCLILGMVLVVLWIVPVLDELLPGEDTRIEFLIGGAVLIAIWVMLTGNWWRRK